MNLFAALTALSASLVMTGAALSQSEDTDEAPFVPEGYELTGETRSCLSLTRIDSIDTVDESAWLVTMRNRDAYVTRVGRGCRSATRAFTYISYSVPGTQLCQGEIVRVMDQGTNTVVGSCGIGEFEKLSPLPEDAS
ncbi:hypothetical protein [Oceanicaulis sp.]|uniref:hypothetical protein n=1 Tax=Oceanicaulis sp. TaxID=1924941 RepID=UPI003BA9A2E8